MAAKKYAEPKDSNGTLIQFTLSGLVIFSVSLVAVSAWLTYALTTRGFTRGSAATPTATTADTPGVVGPWGELKTSNIQLERPKEYVAYEVMTNAPPAWVFGGMTPERARELMLHSGLTAAQAQAALAPEKISVTASNTTVYPDDTLLLALTPEVRGKFYHELAAFSQNRYIAYPFCFPQNSFETIVADGRLSPPVMKLVKSLLYQRGGQPCFSDFELVMRRIASQDERVSLMQALSRQSAVLVRLKISPATDIEKMVNYWGAASGVLTKDIRPLMDSLKRLPEGGTMSLLYFLPPFARERLYNFPLPPQPGEPRMDCHWTTMNFFNDAPDTRFSDEKYTVQYIKNNYHQVAKATAYGDRVFLLDEKNNAIHSAVYIADDIVFTKNGDNYMQPWMLMHLKDLLATYPPGVRVMAFRNRSS